MTDIQKQKDRWNDWEGKRVFLITKRSLKYTCNVEEVSDVNAPARFLYGKDKFGSTIIIAISEIDLIKEVET